MLALKSSPNFPYKSYHDEMSAELSIFQTTDIERCYFVNSPAYAVPKHMKACTISVSDDDIPVFIVPALVNDSKLELAGHANGICELSPIYFGESESNLRSYVEFFLNESGFHEYLFTRIRESSKFSRILGEGIDGYDISATGTENVAIDFGSGHDAWFQALSKSTRQNLRTAYNRLAKDEKDIRIGVSYGAQVSHSLMNKLIDIYIKRHNERYDVKTSALKSFYLRYLDFSTRALMKNPNALHIYIYIYRTELPVFAVGT